jgi:hypothetical protein
MTCLFLTREVSSQYNKKNQPINHSTPTVVQAPQNAIQWPRIDAGSQQSPYELVQEILQVGIAVMYHKPIGPR